MKEKLLFQDKNENDLIGFLKQNKQTKILNFLNLHELYQFNKEKIYQKAVIEKNNINFIDGFVISAYLSFNNIKRVPRVRGPTFTRSFLSNPDLSKNKRHFFIGFDNKDFKNLKKNFPHLKNISCYNPPYIKNLKFSKKEINKISKLINKFKPDYVWVGIGASKQNILSSDLSKKTTAQYFINIGAALDFLIGKKREAPLIVRELGIEWFYRLVTDFKYSKKKVWRSLIGLKYLRQVKLQ